MVDDLQAPVWIGENHYYQILPGQFGYGWDLFAKGGKLIAMSGTCLASRELARDAAIGAWRQHLSPSPEEAAV